MHIDLMFPSLYLKAADLQGREVTLTFSRVTLDELTRQGGSKEKKPVAYFVETAEKARRAGTDEKRLVLNKTNAHAIKAMYGPETNDWPGKRVTLYTARVTFGRQTVDAIRVKEQVPPNRNRPEPEPEPDNDGDPAEDFANMGGMQ